VAVAELCNTLSALYEEADRDLLITAALLHDIGKVDELEWDTAISYTDEGRLLGHVVLGERRVTAACGRLGESVPAELGLALSHVILSHHGELEWGAPKRPASLEALLLHHADNLDAKASGFVEAVGGAGAIEERWSDVTNLFRRPLYVPRPVGSDSPPTPREGDEYVPRSA
jgi:3'-5' exoribonuclease